MVINNKTKDFMAQIYYGNVIYSKPITSCSVKGAIESSLEAISYFRPPTIVKKLTLSDRENKINHE